MEGGGGTGCPRPTLLCEKCPSGGRRVAALLFELGVGGRVGGVSVECNRRVIFYLYCLNLNLHLIIESPY